MKAYSHSKFRKNNGLDDPSINLTPLIDVVFVVLVMFIIVAPLLEIDSIQLAGSSGLDHRPLDPNTSHIHIHVQADDTILINKHVVPQGQLKEYLQFLKQQVPNERPQVYHDKRARFGTYQNLKNSLEELGFEEMDIILQPS
jgi:biopolymer transport protein ExbD